MTDSPVFRLADRIVTKKTAGNPVHATYAGIPGHDDRLTDFSPQAVDDRAAQERGWLAELAALSAEERAR